MQIIIKKEAISLQYLGTQVLDKCPVSAAQNFVEGYLSFVTVFFETLDYGSYIYNVEELSYEADLKIILNITLEKLEEEKNHSEDFWNGVVLATEYSLQIIKLAYNSEAPYSEAA